MTKGKFKTDWIGPNKIFYTPIGALRLPIDECIEWCETYCRDREYYPSKMDANCYGMVYAFCDAHQIPRPVFRDAEDQCVAADVLLAAPMEILNTVVSACRELEHGNVAGAVHRMGDGARAVLVAPVEATTKALHHLCRRF